MIKNILLWGGKSQALICQEMIFKKKIKYFDKIEKNFKINNPNNSNQYLVKYIYDPYLKEVEFNTNAKFSNKKNDLLKFVNKSDLFVVCIGGEHGMARYLISLELEKLGLKPFDIVSNHSYIDYSTKTGKGLQVMPNALIHSFCKIGDFCILNSSSTIDHECDLGNGVHIMGGASVAGRVKIGNFVTIGTNATILPDIKIANKVFIGAGAVVTKNVNENEVVVGNPARFLKNNKHNYSLDDFK